jgi:hypothetical protein
LPLVRFAIAGHFVSVLEAGTDRALLFLIPGGFVPKPIISVHIRNPFCFE